MSFVFEWDKLDDEVALQIEGMIHAHFQRIPKPTFMGNIAVSKFRFGSTPPNITVLDVTDPLEEWYVHMDQEEARLAQEAAEGGGGESMDEDELASGEEYDDEYSYSGDGSIVMRNQSDSYRRTGLGNQPSFPPSPIPVSKRHENDIQLLLAVHYQGQMGFTVETELLLNYPTYAFLTLPVKLVITGFSFKTKMLMGYLRDHVNVSFLEPEDPNESILSNVRIESQVGDEQKQAVLKNVGKIERFVVEQLRKFITEDFVYPSYHSIELVRAPAPAPPPTSAATAQTTDTAAGSAQSLNTVGSTSRDRSSSSRGISPAASITAESVIHEPYRQGSERGIGRRREGGRGGVVGSRGSAGSTTTTASLHESSSLRARPRAASTYSRH
ncbi:hypothetical protein F5H01DRAFT_299236 [Linnemannia elongata]|nr:hypothetical protein F5H01DRAFT_299236 [Linnemannia elongata]